jgi:WD40 repeat protein
MTEQLPSSAIENKVRAALSAPEPDPLFVSGLEAQLLSQPGKRRPNGWFPPRLIFSRRLIYSRRLFSSRWLAWGVALALLALLAIFLAVGPQRVLAAFRQVFGYLPGVGIVEQSAPIRVLAEPVSLTRGDITLTVTDATLTADKTVVVFTLENVPWSAFSHDENVSGCSGVAELRLPDGTVLQIVEGGGAMGKTRLAYAPLPPDVNRATFILPCIQNTLPGKAPENWELPLHFKSAPPDLTVAPVIGITPTIVPETPDAQQAPVETKQWTPENPSEATGLYGISLRLDKYIPLDDGYYLIGHTDWKDDRITSASPAGWALKVYDAKGQEVPIEPANWRDAGLTPGPNQWLYKIYGKNSDAPLTLQSAQMAVEFKKPIQMTLDLRSTPFEFSDEQADLPYKTGLIPLDVPGILAKAFKATYIKEGDLRGFEIGIQADPALQGLPLRFESGLDTSGLSGIASGGGSNRDEATGLVLSTVLTNARMSFPLVLGADNATINGTWETTWNPPAGAPNATPLIVPRACLTLDAWKQAMVNPSSIPAGLPQKVLVSRGAIAPNPSLFISSLDGSTDQGLVFGHGSLSPDGKQLVYSAADNRLYVMDIQSKENTPLTNGNLDMAPFWSPDGTRIAFSRQTDKGSNVYIMDAGEDDVRALTDTTDNPMLIGWTADSRRLILSIWQQDENRIQALDVNSEAVQPLITTGRPWLTGASISPDEDWIAYVDRVPGRMAPGIFVSRLDGTERRLLIQLDTWTVGLPLWSPDGNWLAFLATNTDTMRLEETPGLVNVNNCQVIPLANLDGVIQSWLNP